MTEMYPGFNETRLDATSVFYVGRLLDPLIPHAAAFEKLWNSRPREFRQVWIPGQPMKLPRYEQAFGPGHEGTGISNHALSIPPTIQPFLDWARDVINPRLNDVLLNWLDAARAQSISEHRDSRANMIEGAPIVTISFGAERVFRLRPWKQKGEPIDFAANNGAVFIMPYETNLAWTHEVLHRARDRGRRISVTLRAFGDDIA